MLIGIFDQPTLEAAARALGTRLQPGDVLGLSGAVGAGKTTFTRALARGLGVDRPDRVCSPTFNLCLIHPGRVPLVHVDLYRLAGEGSHAGFEALGLDALLDMMDDDGSVELELRRGVLVIEWIELLLDAGVLDAGVLDTPVLSGSLRLAFERPPGQDDVRRIEAVPGNERYETRLRAWQSELVSAG